MVHSNICTWLLEKPELWLYRPMSAKWCLCFLINYLGLSKSSFQEASVFYFMAAVTIPSDLGAQENTCHCFHVFTFYLPWSDGTRCHDLDFFLMLSFKPAFPLSFTFIKRLFTSSLLLAIRVASSVYLKLLIFLPAILITGCTSSSPAFHMMYSAKKLNKQGDNIQPCRTPFPILNQSVVPYKVLMVASWLAYRSLRMQVRQSGVPVSLRIFHSLLQSTQSKAFA